MPTITDIAVCIRTWDFSETSQTVSLFVREHGIVRGLAKGSRREKGAFSGGIDVLTRGQVVAIIKSGRDLATITAWHLQEMYRSVRQNLAANRAGLYMADLVHHMLIDHDPHPQVFDAFATSLGQLEESSNVDLSLLQFQWTLLTETGYQPRIGGDLKVDEVSDRRSTVLFSPLAGGVVADDAGSSNSAESKIEGWRVRRQTIEVLRSLQ
ncbi:MAG: DNA repair protein RecO, partial [Phycisphaerales bacterium]|nr:DNA repair protein RecO [Phycisphaerales bacterium]